MTRSFVQVNSAVDKYSCRILLGELIDRNENQFCDLHVRKLEIQQSPAIALGALGVVHWLPPIVVAYIRQDAEGGASLATPKSLR